MFLRPYRSQQAGFTLLEVMIAILILSFGLLGIAGLQIRSVKVNQGSVYRSVAALRANEIADRMRANPAGYIAGNYFTYLSSTALPVAGDDPGCAVEHPGISGLVAHTHTVSSDCSADNLAKDDAYIWRVMNAGTLPSGSGIVCRATDAHTTTGTPASTDCDAAGSRVVIKIWWDDQRAGGDANQMFSTVFLP